MITRWGRHMHGPTILLTALLGIVSAVGAVRNMTEPGAPWWTWVAPVLVLVLVVGQLVRSRRRQRAETRQ
jgi:uncharacterized membrane protein YdcZ (DUF606 family)